MKTVNTNPPQLPRLLALFSASVGRLILVPVSRPNHETSNPLRPPMPRQRSLGLVSSLLFLALSSFLCSHSLLAAPAYVQSAYADPQTSQTTVSVTYSVAQGAGDLNVVVVGWNDTTDTVSSVTDSQNNTYQLAVGPTKESSSLTQSIYYATNIVGGSNTVTITFSGAAAYPDIRILEYSGLNLSSPLDVAAGASGTGTSSSSGAITTTSASDLLVGANIVTSTTKSAGSGYTKRILTSPDGDIVEDRTVSSTGSYTATATISSGGWVMQVVAFRAAGQATPTPTPT
ncbi:MAG: hypothetical protein WAK31_15405, partial [Chthoniobacterales bacterium]